MYAQPSIINDEIYHPLIREIVFYPPPDFSLRLVPGKSKSGSARFRRLRQKLYDQDPNCFYCKRYLLFLESTIDHKVPRSKGGSNKFENFVLSCKKCNNAKGDSSFEDFLNERKSQY